MAYQSYVKPLTVPPIPFASADYDPDTEIDYLEEGDRPVQYERHIDNELSSKRCGSRPTLIRNERTGKESILIYTCGRWSCKRCVRNHRHPNGGNLDGKVLSRAWNLALYAAAPPEHYGGNHFKCAKEVIDTLEFAGAGVNYYFAGKSGTGLYLLLHLSKGIRQDEEDGVFKSLAGRGYELYAGDPTDPPDLFCREFVKSLNDQMFCLERTALQFGRKFSHTSRLFDPGGEDQEERQKRRDSETEERAYKEEQRRDRKFLTQAAAVIAEMQQGPSVPQWDYDALERRDLELCSLQIQILEAMDRREKSLVKSLGETERTTRDFSQIHNELGRIRFARANQVAFQKSDMEHLVVGTISAYDATMYGRVCMGQSPDPGPEHIPFDNRQQAAEYIQRREQEGWAVCRVNALMTTLHAPDAIPGWVRDRMKRAAAS